MTVWFDNQMTIIVPSARRRALQDALKGPEEHQCVGIYTTPPKPSAHVEIVLQKTMGTGAAQAAAAFREAHPQFPPDMPICYQDMRAWLTTHGRDHNPGFAEVPFSVPRLCPITPALFARHFSGTIDAHGWWHASTSHRAGSVALNHEIIGSKWMPASVAHEAILAHPRRQGHDVLVLSCMTAGLPLSNLPVFLQPVLDAHQAKALVVWMGGDLHSGLSYFGPKHAPIATNFVPGAFGTTEILDDGNIFHQWDIEALEKNVLAQVHDPDFHPQGWIIVPDT